MEEQESIENFIDSMHQAHLDNAKIEYLAVQDRRHRISIMPVTPFLFDYFIYNSLYAIDWERSFTDRKLCEHDRSLSERFTEGDAQKAFEKFILSKTNSSFEIFYKAFEPFAYIDYSGDWTTIYPSGRIKESDGVKFWERARTIKDFLLDTEKDTVSNKYREILKEMRIYVYSIRNNIFHGTKKVGINSDMDQNHKKRIQIYDLFIRCLTSWFFLSIGKREIASTFTQISIDGLIDQVSLINAKNARLMKDKDGFLVSRLRSIIKEHKLVLDKQSQSDALIYPASGKDMIVPLLIGIDICDEFIFIDRCIDYQYENLFKGNGVLRNLRSVLHKIIGVRDILEPEHKSALTELIFTYKNAQKKLVFINDDAMNAVYNIKSRIKVFFHRDDAGGEFTSDIPWLLTEVGKLKQKLSFSDDAFFITNMQIDSDTLTIIDSFSWNRLDYKIAKLS